MVIFFRTLSVGLILVLIWQLVVTLFNLPFYILPTPKAVFFTLIEQHALLFLHAQSTLIEIAIGLGLGVILGTSAGFLIVFFRPLGLWFFPILIISQAIPTFAIAPLIVIWLGYGIASKIAVTVLMIFFPVTSAFYDGLKRTDPGWLDLAKTMNATQTRLYFRILVPSALPALASGIRIAAVTAPLGALVGEWVGSSSGLGYLMLNANARMQTDQLFAALIVVILIAITLYFSIDKLLRKLIWWQV